MASKRRQKEGERAPATAPIKATCAFCEGPMVIYSLRPFIRNNEMDPGFGVCPRCSPHPRCNARHADVPFSALTPNTGRCELRTVAHGDEHRTHYHGVALTWAGGPAAPEVVSKNGGLTVGGGHGR